MKPISSPSLKPLLFISSLYSNKSDDDTILLPSSLDLNDNILNDDETIENKDKYNNSNNSNDSDIDGFEQFDYSDDSCEFDIFDNFEGFEEEEFNFQQNNKLTEQIFINVVNTLLIEE